MTLLIYAAMFGALPLALLFFFTLPKRRAVLVSYVTLWLFLPVYEFTFSGIPDYDKATAVNLAMLLGVVLTDFSRVTRFRPRYWDIFIVLFLLLPMGTAVSNNLGLWEGLSSIFEGAFKWAIPYIIGRLYFRTLEDFQELALAVFVGGLVYVPLAIFEFRMAPVLHHLVYGFHQHQFVQTLRGGGGYRPMIFLEHGLAFGMWMTAACLCGFWLWRRGALKTLFTIPVYYFMGLLYLVTFYARSFGALALLMGGLLVAEASRVLHTRALLLLIALIPPTYVGVRGSGLWDGDPVPFLVAQIFGPTRASSLDTRFRNENLMSGRARLRPVLGWGRFGRSRLSAYGQSEATAVDSLWIIFIGRYGFARIVFYFLVFLLPVVLILRVPGRAFFGEAGAGLLSMTLVLLLAMMDNMVNAMYNPIFVMVPGGLVTTLSGTPRFERSGEAETAQPLRPPPVRSGWVTGFSR